jgi:hypothetical protein
MRIFNSKKISMAVLVCAFISMASLYQNCTASGPITFKSLAMSGGGNGEGYEGKLSIYSYTSPTSPCTDLDNNGKPLPNSQIFHYSSQNLKLVRETCKDITPVQINPNSVQITNGGNTIIYQGLDYLAPDRGDFAVVKAQCPTGMVEKPTAQRVNLFQDSQFVSGDNVFKFDSGWWIQDGIATTQVGSLAGLPSWTIYRNSTTSDYWKRATQPVTIAAGKMYSYTFLARKGTIDKAGLFLYQCGVQPCNPRQINIVVSFDLTQKTYAVVDSTGDANFKVSMRPLGDATIITVYFTPSGVTEILDGGVMPYDSTNTNYYAPMGDAIEATAFQLEDVSNYCQ